MIHAISSAFSGLMQSSVAGAGASIFGRVVLLALFACHRTLLGGHAGLNLFHPRASFFRRFSFPHGLRSLAALLSGNFRINLLKHGRADFGVSAFYLRSPGVHRFLGCQSALLRVNERMHSKTPLLMLLRCLSGGLEFCRRASLFRSSPPTNNPIAPEGAINKASANISIMGYPSHLGFGPPMADPGFYNLHDRMQANTDKREHPLLFVCLAGFCGFVNMLLQSLRRVSGPSDIANLSRSGVFKKVYAPLHLLYFTALTAILPVFLMGQDPAAVAPYQLFTFDGNSGNVTACANCYIYTFLAGTNTNAPTYTDSSLATPNTNPVRTNGNGYAVNGSTVTGIWVGSTCLKFVAKDSSMATMWTTDNLCDRGAVLKALLSGATGAAQIGFRPTNGDTTITVATALNSFLIDSGYTTWSIACAAAQGATKTLIVTKLWTGVTSVPCATWFVSGGLLRVAASTAASVTGSITAPPWQQIFDTTTNSAASVTIAPKCAANLYSQWWGAQWDNSTNDTAAHQSAIAAAIASAIPIAWTAGESLITSLNILQPSCNPQTNANPCQLSIVGAGHGATFIRTATAAVDALASVSTGANFPVLRLEGFTLIGPDGSGDGGAGVSGNGIQISGPSVPHVDIADVYIRGFFGAGKAGLWLDTAEGATLDTVRVDISDIGFKFTNAANIHSANNLQTSAVWSYGYYVDGMVGGSLNNISAQGTHCTGFSATAMSGVVLNGVYFEHNNISGSCHGIELKANVRGNSFIGIVLNDVADDLFLNGTSGGANPITGNTFTDANAINGGQGPVVINTVFSTGNTWNWYGVQSKWSGAGNLGFEFGNFLACQYALLAVGATTVTGGAPCNLYRTQNSAPTSIDTLPALGTANFSDGFTVKVFVNDTNTTFVTGGNLRLPSGGASLTAKQNVMYQFTSFADNGAFWLLTGVF